jgi:hypothetical protein
MQHGIKIVSYPGLGETSKIQSTSGQNVGVGLYFQPTEEFADNCAYCSSGWTWIDGKVQCYDASKSDFRTCPIWGVGNKFVSLKGTMADLNLVLSNVTYIGDKNFNTRYGQAEAITVLVNDNGAIGDVLHPLSFTRVINVAVESVNDPPIIGHLVPELGDQVLDPKTLITINMYQFNLNIINQSKHLVEVDEDVVFTFNHTWLWIDDVDAIEAVSIQTMLMLDGSSAQVAYEKRTYTCNSGWDSAGLLDLGSSSCVFQVGKGGFSCSQGLRQDCACQSVDDSFSCARDCSCSLQAEAGCCICSRPPVCPNSTGSSGLPVTIYNFYKIKRIDI